jgi:hypothetical protein
MILSWLLVLLLCGVSYRSICSFRVLTRKFKLSFRPLTSLSAYKPVPYTFVTVPFEANKQLLVRENDVSTLKSLQLLKKKSVVSQRKIVETLVANNQAFWTLDEEEEKVLSENTTLIPAHDATTSSYGKSIMYVNRGTSRYFNPLFFLLN